MEIGARSDRVDTAMGIACLQVEVPDEESSTARLERVTRLIHDIAPSVDVLVLPELWTTGYFAFERYAEEAEPRDGCFVNAMAALARQQQIHLAAGSFVEREGDQLFNTAVFFGPDGQLLQSYRKIHLFGYGSLESSLLSPGEGLSVARTSLGVVGTTTCYDLRFPELYRLLGASGLEILLLPAAWPKARVEHWRTLLKARAIENQLLVIACNTTGLQQGVILGGTSMIVNPWGEVVAELGVEPGVLQATVDPRIVPEVRSEFPVLTHRRISDGALTSSGDATDSASTRPL